MSEAETPETPADPRFAAVRHLARRRIEDQFVVLDLRRSRIFGLNSSAGEVLEALQRPRTIAQLAQRFALTVAETSLELQRFLDELAALEWLEASPVTAEFEQESDRSTESDLPLWAPPAILWQEEVARVTSQVSPPQQIGNPACLP